MFLISRLSYHVYCTAGMLRNIRDRDYNGESHKKDLDLSTFDLSTIFKATDNFSINNKLGEGGFGPVYKVKFGSAFCSNS